VGQGDVNATPLQMAMVYAAIANGGTLYKPQLVQRIEDLDGRVIESFDPQVVRKLEINPAHRKTIVDALVSVVNEPGGTAYRVRLKDVVVAGKTGTAQVAAIGAVRLKTHQMDYWVRHHAWFTSFAPAENPEIAVVVLNEHGGGGGTDAAPTAMAVIQKYFDLKKEDASSPPPRANQPYVLTLPPAPKLEDVLTRSANPPAPVPVRSAPQAPTPNATQH
jgi:penicillin-binding protein 2